MFIHTHCSISHAWNACVLCMTDSRATESHVIFNSHMIFWIMSWFGHDCCWQQRHRNTKICRPYEWVLSHVWVSQITYMTASWFSHDCCWQQRHGNTKICQMGVMGSQCIAVRCVCCGVLSNMYTGLVTENKHISNASCHICVACVAWASVLQCVVCVAVYCPKYTWGLSRMKMRVMSHMCRVCGTTHVTRMNEPCHICHTSFQICMNDSCHTSEWVMSHILMSHVTHLNESCHTYVEWALFSLLNHFDFCHGHIWGASVLQCVVCVAVYCPKYT